MQGVQVILLYEAGEINKVCRMLRIAAKNEHDFVQQVLSIFQYLYYQ